MDKKFAKITNGKVEQCQPYKDKNCSVEVPADTLPGMIDNGDGTFSDPTVAPTTPDPGIIDLILDYIATGNVSTKLQGLIDNRIR